MASSHRLVLVLCLGALLVAVILGALETSVQSFQMDDLPVACAFMRATGTPCPGCGLTRSWVALGRGNLGDSLAFHRFGWLVMAYVGLQALRHALWLWGRGLRPAVDRAGKWLDRGLILLAVALFANWGWVLAG